MCLLHAPPLSFPRFDTTVIQVVLLPGVEHKLPVVAPIFLKGIQRFKCSDFQMRQKYAEPSFVCDIVQTLYMRPKTLSTSGLEEATQASSGSS